MCNCSGNCSGCNGCSEKVTLSCNKEISFVSSISFSVRNFYKKTIRLVTLCKRTDDVGICTAQIKFYKNGESTDNNTKAYEITNTELTCLNLDFEPDSDADKGEVIIKCENGATLEIEQINVLVI